MSVKQTLGRLLRKTGYTVARTEPRTTLAFKAIPGWFSATEAEALYLLAATSQARRWLEVGHFLGRSTSAVCEAIRDAGLSVEFNSYDLGFTSAEEFAAHYRRVHDAVSHEPPEEFERLVFSRGATTTELARRNLDRLGLGRFVNLVSGDFSQLDRTRYGFVFCDALHDRGEIGAVLPAVVAASEDDCVWAFHDSTPANVGDVKALCPEAAHLRTFDTLGVYRYRRVNSASSGTARPSSP